MTMPPGRMFLLSPELGTVELFPDGRHDVYVSPVPFCSWCRLCTPVKERGLFQLCKTCDAGFIDKPEEQRLRISEYYGYLNRRNEEWQT